jgi:hypothetical protein
MRCSKRAQIADESVLTPTLIEPELRELKSSLIVWAATGSSIAARQKCFLQKARAANRGDQSPNAARGGHNNE